MLYIATTPDGYTGKPYELDIPCLQTTEKLCGPPNPSKFKTIAAVSCSLGVAGKVASITAIVLAAKSDLPPKAKAAIMVVSSCVMMASLYLYRVAYGYIESSSRVEDAGIAARHEGMFSNKFGSDYV